MWATGATSDDWGTRRFCGLARCRCIPVIITTTLGADGRLRRTANMAGAFWSPFATRWYFQVNPANGFQIENIEDIEIRMRLVTGRPGCPPGWEETCGERQ